MGSRPDHGKKYLDNPEHQPRVKDMIGALGPEWSQLMDRLYDIASRWPHASHYVASNAAQTTSPEYRENLATVTGSDLVTIMGQAFLPFRQLADVNAGIVGGLAFDARAIRFHSRVQDASDSGNL